MPLRLGALLLLCAFCRKYLSYLWPLRGPASKALSVLITCHALRCRQAVCKDSADGPVGSIIHIVHCRSCSKVLSDELLFGMQIITSAYACMHYHCRPKSPYHFCLENTRTFRLLSATRSVQPSWRATAFHRGIHPKTAGSAKQMIDPKASVRFCTSQHPLTMPTVTSNYCASRITSTHIAAGKRPLRAFMTCGDGEGYMSPPDQGEAAMQSREMLTCLTMLLVSWATCSKKGSASAPLSDNRMTSATAAAASLGEAATAMPTLAAAKAGASFTPSPTCTRKIYSLKSLQQHKARLTKHSKTAMP